MRRKIIRNMDIKEMESIIEQKDKELRKLSHELMNSKARCSLLKNDSTNTNRNNYQTINNNNILKRKER